MQTSNKISKIYYETEMKTCYLISQYFTDELLELAVVIMYIWSSFIDTVLSLK